MDFILAKTIQSLITPPGGLVLMIAAGVLVLASCRCFGRILIIAGFLLLYLLSTSPVSDALLKPLEKNASETVGSDMKADAIIVLGGGVKDLSWLDAPPEPSSLSIERVVRAVRLYRVLQRPLVIMGGNGSPSRMPQLSEADAMARVAGDLGVPARNIIIENKSRNTLESARSLKDIIKGRRIILITSAFHLKRASGMFRKQGFSVTPLSAAYLCERRTLSFQSFIPNASNLASSSAAISEYISLFFYSLKREL